MKKHYKTEQTDLNTSSSENNYINKVDTHQLNLF